MKPEYFPHATGGLDIRDWCIRSRTFMKSKIGSCPIPENLKNNLLDIICEILDVIFDWRFTNEDKAVFHSILKNNFHLVSWTVLRETDSAMSVYNVSELCRDIKPEHSKGLLDIMEI